MKKTLVIDQEKSLGEKSQRRKMENKKEEWKM